MFEALHSPECSHGFTFDFQPYVRQQWVASVCDRVSSRKRNAWPNDHLIRIQQIASELQNYSRFAVSSLKLKVAERIFLLEKPLTTGNEEEALQRY